MTRLNDQRGLSVVRLFVLFLFIVVFAIAGAFNTRPGKAFITNVLMERGYQPTPEPVTMIPGMATPVALFSTDSRNLPRFRGVFEKFLTFLEPVREHAQLEKSFYDGLFELAGSKETFPSSEEKINQFENEWKRIKDNLGSTLGQSYFGVASVSGSKPDFTKDKINPIEILFRHFNFFFVSSLPMEFKGTLMLMGPEKFLTKFLSTYRNQVMRHDKNLKKFEASLKESPQLLQFWNDLKSKLKIKRVWITGVPALEMSMGKFSSFRLYVALLGKNVVYGAKNRKTMEKMIRAYTFPVDSPQKTNIKIVSQNKLFWSRFYVKNISDFLKDPRLAIASKYSGEVTSFDIELNVTGKVSLLVRADFKDNKKPETYATMANALLSPYKLKPKESPHRALSEMLNVTAIGKSLTAKMSTSYEQLEPIVNKGLKAEIAKLKDLNNEVKRLKILQRDKRLKAFALPLKKDEKNNYTLKAPSRYNLKFPTKRWRPRYFVAAGTCTIPQMMLSFTGYKKRALRFKDFYNLRGKAQKVGLFKGKHNLFVASFYKPRRSKIMAATFEFPPIDEASPFAGKPKTCTFKAPPFALVQKPRR